MEAEKSFSGSGRISLRDLKDVEEDIDSDDKNMAPVAKIDELTPSEIEIGPFESSLETVDAKISADENLEKGIHVQSTGGKIAVGLRRSHSDAADVSTSLDEKAQAGANLAENSSSADKHHRLSFASALKSASPVLRRRQTGFDTAFHNLLQEGKEFLHRKSQKVPLLASHFGHHHHPKMETSATTATLGSTASHDSSNSSESPFTRTGSLIIYRKKDDSISLENDVDLEPEIKVQMLAPMEKGDQLVDIPGDSILVKQSKPPPPPPRPKALPRRGSGSRKEHHFNDESGKVPFVAGVFNSGSKPFKPSPFWDYYKHVIAGILLALTATEALFGFRSLPIFVLGILWGAFISYLLAIVVFRFCLPADRFPSFGEKYEPSPIDEEHTFMSQVSEEELLKEDGLVYKGWMNRLPNKYNPETYHINKAHTVLVRLDRNTLRISTPKVNLGRHAFCRDPRDTPAFISQEMFDMTGACVFLRPKNLAHRRWWSRKYPISIVFAPKDTDKDDQGRRDSSPFIEIPRVRSDILSAKQAADANDSDKSSTDTKEPTTEVAVDALVEEVHGHNGAQLTETDDTADEADDEAEEGGKRLLQPTLSLPSDLGALGNGVVSKRNGFRTQKRRRRVVNLFARSTREKENWFYKLRRSACYYSYADRRERLKSGLMEGAIDNAADTEIPATGVPVFTNLSLTTDEQHFLKKEDPLATEWILYMSMQKQYERHMREYMSENRPKLEVQSMDLTCMMWKTWMGNLAETSNDSKVETPSTSIVPNLSIEWANAFGSRLFYDFSRNPVMMDKVRHRIQSKLASIHLPYFIETLELTELEPGMTAPKIIAINEPSMNEWGLWIDAKLEYGGGIRLVLETKVNLMKLKTEAAPPIKKKAVDHKMANYENNDFPESPESSPDEDAQTGVPNVHHQHHQSKSPGQESTGKKILHFVDKLAHSKYFQEATENKYLKKLMQGVSDTPLILEVEVAHLAGPLCINIPPPPSDRIWWSFRFPPQVVLKARPRVGERAVNLSHITDWIENKLVLLLEKNLVIPNMDDLRVPVMGGSPLHRTYNQ